MFSFFKRLYAGNENARPFIFKYAKNRVANMSYEDTFLSNPCVNRAISIIANSISTCGIVVLNNGELDKTCLTYKILKSPSVGVYTADFINNLVINYLLYGNAFILLDADHNLRNLVNEAVSIHVHKASHEISFYSIKINEQDVMTVYRDSSLPLIGHFKNFNPVNPVYGYSCLEPIHVAANLYHAIDCHNLALIKNGSRPAGIVTASPTHPLTKEEEEMLKQQLEEQYVGPDQTGKIIFLNKEFAWQQLSSASKDMDYNAASKRVLRSIAAGLGVPASLIGDVTTVGENARSSLEAIFNMFERSTLMPLANKLAQFLTAFFNDLEPNIEVKLVDNNTLPALEEYEKHDKGVT